jgi:carotenoid cleavage dioxygenase-like enzyme
MVHDFMVTKNQVLFPVLPLAGSFDRAMSGKPTFAWEPSMPAYVGIMKHDADVSAVRWFEYDSYVYHLTNAYEAAHDRRRRHAIRCGAALPRSRRTAGRPRQGVGPPHALDVRSRRQHEQLQARASDDLAGEFPRFDERRAGLDYCYGYFAARSDG